LCNKLVEAHRSGQPVVEKIGEYENAMRGYGFEAVAASRKALDQAVTPRKFGFKLAMSVMRVATRVPALRRRILEQQVTRPRKTLAEAS